MIIYKIPKPINIIGEFSNKAITYASCNFTYASKFFIKNKFLINKNYSKFLKNYLKFNKNKKYFDLIIDKNENFYSCHSLIYGGFNLYGKFNNKWFSEPIVINELFFKNILVFYIKKKNFLYSFDINENGFNVDLVNKLVDDAVESYNDLDFKHLGKIIDSYWRLKIQTDTKCRNQYISKLYSDCMLAGAWGGKMDENIMFLIAPQEKHEHIKKIMKDNILLNSNLYNIGIQKEEVFNGNSNCCR